ncbi:MAG: potassium-transporting ATPase subunit KdpB [Phycisphaerae bacterium]|nr:potassium-transporting ATPase subunit KdpB [Phycisphaerae bacterium]
MSSSTSQSPSSIFNPALVRPAIGSALAKLDPRVQLRNPVMFVVWVVSALTTMLAVAGFAGKGEAGGYSPTLVLVIAVWLWFTVLFANFAEAMAEGRGKAQAASLRKSKRDVAAKKLGTGHWALGTGEKQKSTDIASIKTESVSGASLRKGDIVLVQAGDTIPSDGEVIEGVASVNESAVTGESAPVIREAGGDRSSVVGGTQVLSDWLIVRIAADPGSSFLDRMIAMVEGAKRQKTPNEIALDILLAALTITFLLACATLLPYSIYAVMQSRATDAASTAQPITVTVLVALLVCLIPTTIGGLLSAIRIAGMDRLVQANVIATSGRAVEAAGDVDVLLLDKTGTITFGNRMASAFYAVDGVTAEQLADAAQLSSLADETPEGRSIVVLAKQKYNIRERDMHALGLDASSENPAGKPASFVPFTANTRMSGVDLPLSTQYPQGRQIRKGSADAIDAYVSRMGGTPSVHAREIVSEVSKRGSTPLVVADGKGKTLGVIELKDIVKGGIAERFAELRRMGIKTVMITGDNPVTAAAIAAEAGVDDFLAQATPEAKLKLIREYQQGGRLVAMTGDGTNDAPALAQADVAVAMNSGTQAAKEAGNMVDLDSNPTKLIEIVRIGKQLLVTRGSLTTFSIANDVAKYFAIIPAAFMSTYPALGALNIMRLNPATAILSSVAFNALIIVVLIPLALRGVKYRPVEASRLLGHNLLVYGVGGLLVPFAGIKVIDVLVNVLPVWN